MIPPGSHASVLNAPTKLTVSAARRTVTLHWSDRSNNEAGFYIERAPHSAKFARFAQVGANVNTFTLTEPPGIFSYRVQAFNPATGQVSAYSNQVQVRVR